MKIYNKIKTAVVGPDLVSAKDEQGRVWWRLSHADGCTPRRVQDRAELHKWMRDQGYTRFKEDGQLKMFPEDPDYGGPI